MHYVCARLGALCSVLVGAQSHYIKDARCITARLNILFWSKEISQRGTWNPSIYNIIRWVAWRMGQMNCRPRVWCSKYHFFNTFYRFRALKTQKNNTWNIRCLVDDSKVNGWFICPIVQATQRIIFWIDEILYIMTLGDAAVDKRNGVKETSAEKLDSTMHLSKRIENPESQQNWHSVQS